MSTKSSTRIATLVRDLSLLPHPEGGRYARVHTSALQVQHEGITRPACTAIRFLLVRGECSDWHRIDADETWQWEEGGALELLSFDPQHGLQRYRMDASERGGLPSVVIPAGSWQAARPLDDYSLVRCVVAPGFLWERFQLLPVTDPLAAYLPKLSG
ncbi:cupin domain-containing protein [Xanthomonas bonasiae]|uniref:cupin domain-containing protein n=1 Tax=Xanthomonas bonasiae TaxID=2810351 RepID=UPI0017815EE9|nr:cupin domain-containing protein [Xanthomonas surreyensis]MBD7920420.1 cupin domain-containing protein [Xanthomonas surreyensis]